MALFKARKSVTIDIYVYSKDQKEALFDIMTGFVEKPVYLSHTKKFIKYQIVFNYTVNYNSFYYEYSGLYFKYKFQFFKVKN